VSAPGVDDADVPPPPLELVDFDEPPQAATNMPVAATTVAKITDRFTAPSSCGPRPIGLGATLPRGRRACPVDRRSENRGRDQARA